MIDSIQAADVNEALRGTRLHGCVRHLRCVDSTNRLALAAAAAGETFGAWVADEQTAGRGRGGHTWHSAPGEGLYVSALFTAHMDAAAVIQLSLVAGLAAQEAIETVAGLTIDLRWPNDLVTYGRPPNRKLGGILVETALTPAQAVTGSSLRHAVIGIGINVNHRAFPAELSALATSLVLEGWRSPDRQALLIALLEQLDWNVRQLEEAGQTGGQPAPGVLARLEAASTWIRGKRVRVGEGGDGPGGDGGYTGVTAGLDAYGFLLVRSDDGTLHTVRSGGVREV